MAKKERLKPGQVVEALKATNGLVYLAADTLGCSVSTVYRYAERYPDVKEAIEHSKGKRLDAAEGMLWKAVLNGEAWAVCFLLKTQGKHRGYTEKVEVDETRRATVYITEEIVDAQDRKTGQAAPGPG